VEFGETAYPEALGAALIAPCGMDCGLCSGHLRAKRVCEGCTGDDAGKPASCVQCLIKNCETVKSSESGFCFECPRFPCPRLRRLDKRYRTKYGMSMVENLLSIQEVGLDRFVALERQRWACAGCGGVICVHRQECIYCGRSRDHGVTTGAAR
jgi:hypothetical protein